MPIPILTHHQKKVTPKSKVVFPNENKNTKVQNELEKQKEEASARMKTSIKESVEKNGFILSGAGAKEESPIPKKDFKMIDLERAVMVGQLIQEDKHLVEKNLWLDEKSLLKSRIVELEACCYSETQEKQKLYSENLRLDVENFTLSTTADELSETLEKNRYLEETLQKRNDLIKQLQEEQYELGETIGTLNLKLIEKDEYLKNLEIRSSHNSESFARSAEKVITQQQIIKDLQDSKFEVEVDLEEAKESILDLNQKFTLAENNYHGASRLYLESDKANDKLREDIFDKEHKLLMTQCNLMSAQRQLKNIVSAFENSKIKIKNLEFELSNALEASRRKSTTIFDQDLKIYQLENSLYNKTKKLFITNFNAAKSTGTLYFAIWLVVWGICLFTFLKFIG